MIEPNNERPAWKFWWPLAFWKVLIIMVVTNVAMQLVVVALREGLGLTFLTSAGAGGGGAILGFAIISGLVRKQRGADTDTDA